MNSLNSKINLNRIVSRCALHFLYKKVMERKRKLLILQHNFPSHCSVYMKDVHVLSGLRVLSAACFLHVTTQRAYFTHHMKDIYKTAYLFLIIRSDFYVFVACFISLWCNLKDKSLNWMYCRKLPCTLYVPFTNKWRIWHFSHIFGSMFCWTKF